MLSVRGSTPRPRDRGGKKIQNKSDTPLNFLPITSYNSAIFHPHVLMLFGLVFLFFFSPFPSTLQSTCPSVHSRTRLQMSPFALPAGKPEPAFPLESG